MPGGSFLLQIFVPIIQDNWTRFLFFFFFSPSLFDSHYADVDPENQNFLLESNLGKKKYETDFVSETQSFVCVCVALWSKRLVLLIDFQSNLPEPGFLHLIIVICLVIVFPLCSIQVLLPLECQYLIWAMRLWAVESLGFLMPWLILELLFLCKYV